MIFIFYISIPDGDFFFNYIHKILIVCQSFFNNFPKKKLKQTKIWDFSQLENQKVNVNYERLLQKNYLHNDSNISQ